MARIDSATQVRTRDSKEETMNGKLLIRVDEAATICSLGRSKMYELVAKGFIPSVRIGRAVRIPIASLREWIAHQVTGLECDT